MALFGTRSPMAPHGLPEEVPVFGLLDGLHRGPDHLHAVPIKNAEVGNPDGRIESRLAAERREERLRPLPLDDPGHEFGVIGSM